MYDSERRQVSRCMKFSVARTTFVAQTFIFGELSQSVAHDAPVIQRRKKKIQTARGRDD